jgi:hypothetical protein
MLIAKDEQEHRAVIAQSKAAHLAARNGIGDVIQLVAWSIAVENTCGDFAAQVVLKIHFGAEGKSTDIGVQAVGADDQIELARRAILEGHVNAVGALFETGDAVTEDGFDALDRLIAFSGRQPAAAQTSAN